MAPRVNNDAGYEKRRSTGPVGHGDVTAALSNLGVQIAEPAGG
jgi:hypothetical protein